MTFYWSIFAFACDLQYVWASCGGGVCVTLQSRSVVAGLYKIYFHNMRKFLFVAGVITIFVYAGVASAQSVTSEDLQRQLNQLQQLLSSLQRQVEAQRVSQPTAGALPPVVVQPTTDTGSAVVTSGFVMLDELPGSPTVSCTLPQLSRGSQGGSVSLLQMFLKQNGNYPQGLITGFYGNLTQQAVRKFQVVHMKDRGLFDGIVDEETANKISSVIGKYFSECGTGFVPSIGVVQNENFIRINSPKESGVQYNVGANFVVDWSWQGNEIQGDPLFDVVWYTPGVKSGTVVDDFRCASSSCQYNWIIPSNLAGLKDVKIAINGGPMWKGGRKYQGISSDNFAVQPTTNVNAPVVSYVQAPQGERNVLVPSTRATVYGNNLISVDAQGHGPDVDVRLVGKGDDRRIVAFDLRPFTIQFNVPKEISEGEYDVFVQQGARTSNRIKVVVRSAPTITAFRTTDINARVPVALSGAALVSGEKVRIKWSFTGAHEVNQFFDITLLGKAFSQGIVTRITATAADWCEKGECFYDWTIPSGVSGDTFQIKVESTGTVTGTGYSPYFSVSSTPAQTSVSALQTLQVNVISPVSGVQTIYGKQMRIAWNFNGTAIGQYFAIDLVGKALTRRVATVQAWGGAYCEKGECGYIWDVPADLSGTDFQFKVEGSGTASGVGYSGYFEITSTTPSITPLVTYVQSSLREKNMLYPNEMATVYGSNLVNLSDSFRRSDVVIVGKGYTERVAGDAYSGSVDFRVPANIPAGEYEFYVEVYAKENRVSNRIKIQGIPKGGAVTSPTLGDVNGDGLVTCFDAQKVLNFSVGLTQLTADEQKRADVSGDGKAGSYDAALIMQKSGFSCGNEIYDYTGDGKNDAADVQHLQQVAAGTMGQKDSKLYDLNTDGKVNILDVTAYELKFGIVATTSPTASGALPGGSVYTASTFDAARVQLDTAAEMLRAMLRQIGQ